MITLYGISNCDTIRKARGWLDARGIEYTFHDYRKDGLDAVRLDAWLDELGFEILLNRRGTTFRKLTEAEKQNIDRDAARKLMLDNPSIIKRPLLDTGTSRIVGFDPEEYRKLAS